MKKIDAQLTKKTLDLNNLIQELSVRLTQLEEDMAADPGDAGETTTNKQTLKSFKTESVEAITKKQASRDSIIPESKHSEEDKTFEEN